MPVNGEVFAWEDLTVFLPTGPALDLTEISYEDGVDDEFVYGQGGVPRGVGKGNFKGSGKVKMRREQYNQLLNYCKAKNKPIYRLPLFNITAAYSNEDQGLSTDQLKRCRFTKKSKKASQGDKSMDVELDYIYMDIEEDGLSQTAGMGL